MSDPTFTHFSKDGRVHMVDVSEKPSSHREAVAQARVQMGWSTRERIEARGFSKGDVLSVAELAGVMGAKQTSALIPLCHPVPLSHISVRCQWMDTGEEDTAYLSIEATARTIGQTGVEMEALTACATAALTVYDMCKAVDRGMVIRDVRLLKKSGGQHGDFVAP